MKKNIVIALILLSGNLFAQDYWIKKDSVNGPPRAAGVSFELNGEGYFATGVNLEEFKRKLYSYDLSSDDWDNETPLGGETGMGLSRASAVGFSAYGYGFVGLGSGSATYLKDLWRYDPVSETWTQMADFQGSARRGAVAFTIDDVAYVGTGESATGLENDFYTYNAAENEWIQIAEFPGGARKEAVGFKMGGKGYFGTGKGPILLHDDFWEYDPLEDQWKQLANFPGTPRMGAVGCGVFPNAYIMLGEDNNFDYRKDVWEYNYFGDVWSQRSDYGGGTRTQASAVVVDNRIFVGLGYNGIYHDDFYEYTRFVSIDESLATPYISVYPNPASEFITINIPKSITCSGLSLFSLSGQELYTTSIQEATTTHTIYLDDKFESGTYILSLQKNTDILFSRTIIIK